MRKLTYDEISRPSPEEVADLPRHPITVVVENVRSIYNVGSMFRTSDAARIERLRLTGYTGTPEHKDLHKTALGAQDTVPWAHHENTQPVLHDLRADGYTLAALEITDQSIPTADVLPEHFPLCLVVGNEVGGVDQKTIEAVDLAFEIPQYGAKQSLNVAVAYGIAVFDLVRQYRSFFGPPAPNERT